jgi:hypothetical protein
MPRCTSALRLKGAKVTLQAREVDPQRPSEGKKIKLESWFQA